MRFLILVAGGTGTRMNRPVAKQFLPLGDRPVIVHTLERFREAVPDLFVVLVLHESLHEEWAEVVRTHPTAAVDRVVNGGAERFHSVRNGLDALPIPISTPGYDVGPYFTAATWITKDIDSSVQNMGVYRGNLKAAEAAGSVEVEGGAFTRRPAGMGTVLVAAHRPPQHCHPRRRRWMAVEGARRQESAGSAEKSGS